jgi:putative peptide zinc metalloprotease protein
MPDSTSYYVIPLTVQKYGDVFLVGNADIEEFYQFPEQGLSILNMLKSGATVDDIKIRLEAESSETIDVDDLVEQLLSMEFIYPFDQSYLFRERAAAMKRTGRSLAIDSRVAKAIFSLPVLACYLVIVGYALTLAVSRPELQINWLAFYTETNRTALFILILFLSIVGMAAHELGHMLAAARYGIRTKYGVSNRLWTIVAQTDLSGIMALPKSQQYLPLFAGILVDVLNISLLTLLVEMLVSYDGNAFVIQVAQAMVLQLIISIIWQFNIFVKTDIYYVLCTYFSHPDLDKDARNYLRGLVHRFSFGQFGTAAGEAPYRNLSVLRVFSAIWILGRAFSLSILFFVALPTIAEYFLSAYRSLRAPSTSLWVAYDTGLFAVLSLSMTSIGIYMWFKQRKVKVAGNWRDQ